jgi:hypothetical protein
MRSHSFASWLTDLEKVNRDLVVRDPDGKPYNVLYKAVNVKTWNSPSRRLPK